MNRHLVFGCAMLALAAAYYASAAAIPETTLGDTVGPAGLPKAYAVILGALALLLIAGSRRSPRADDESRKASPPSTLLDSRLGRVAGLLAIGGLYVALVPWIGYVVAIAALIAGTTYYQGGRMNRQVAAVAVGGALLFWILFVIVLRIQQPSGPW